MEKKLLLGYIHANSIRASSPFVSVSSASIESDKMEEVLFGSEYNGVVKSGLLEKLMVVFYFLMKLLICQKELNRKF